MKKILEIKKDGQKILRVTITGKEFIVLETLERLSESVFGFSNVGGKLRDEINKRITDKEVEELI